VEFDIAAELFGELAGLLQPCGGVIGVVMRRCFQEPSGKGSVLLRPSLLPEGATSIATPQPSSLRARLTRVRYGFLGAWQPCLVWPLLGFSCLNRA
jgi:hypothetical protein